MTLSILILTGQSGGGKSTAIRALEDHGFFCVDNIPTALVEQLIDVMAKEKTCDRLALVMDIRERNFLREAPALVARLRANVHPVRLIFLEAQEEHVIRRYSETRRRHPLDRGAGLRAAIEEEHQLLAPLRELATKLSTPRTCRRTPCAPRWWSILPAFSGASYGWASSALASNTVCLSRQT